MSDKENPESIPGGRKLEAVVTKPEEAKPEKSVEASHAHEEDHDLTRELLDLYQIPVRRRRPEGI